MLMWHWSTGRDSYSKGKYNEDMASYNEECTTLAADGVPKKFWPKKPTHPTQGR